MSSPLAVLVAGIALGLIAGSFLGALVTRWPRGESVMRGRSHCDHCGRTLGPRDLVPLLSAWASGLRCRSCGGRIDPAHSLLEAGAATIGGAAFALAPDMIAAIGWSLLGWCLLALAILDARHFWLPDRLTLPLAFMGFVIGPFTTAASMTDRWIGAAGGYGALLALSIAYRVARGRDGLGLGDAKLLGALGAWGGWMILPFVLFLASLSGLIWAIWIAWRGGVVHAGSRIPLGTFLCVAAGPALWFGNLLLHL